MRLYLICCQVSGCSCPPAYAAPSGRVRRGTGLETCRSAEALVILGLFQNLHNEIESNQCSVIIRSMQRIIWQWHTVLSMQIQALGNAFVIWSISETDDLLSQKW